MLIHAQQMNFENTLLSEISQRERIEVTRGWGGGGYYLVATKFLFET